MKTMHKFSIHLLMSIIFVSSFYAQETPTTTAHFFNASTRNTTHSNATPDYKPMGYLKNKEDVDPVKMNNVLEAAPDHVKVLIKGLKNKKEFLRNSLLRRLILHGEPGNGKTTLATYMMLDAFGQCYVLSCTSILNAYKNCHGNLQAELEPFMQQKEPMGVLFDEVNVLTDQYRRNNSSDENMPTAFQAALDICENRASHLFIVNTTNNDPSDFPDPIKTRFQGSVVHIPYPNFETRTRIIDYQLNDRDHNLSKEEVSDLAQQLEGRSCRYIERMVDYAALYAICHEGRSITHNDIVLAIQANPRELSTDEILAEEARVTIERIKELRARQHILESNAPILDHLHKQAQHTQTERHHTERQTQSDSQHRASQTQSAQQHIASQTQSAQQHRASQTQSAQQHRASQTQSANQHTASMTQSTQQHTASQTQSAQQHQQNHARQNVDGFVNSVVGGAMAGGAVGFAAGGIGAIPGAVGGAFLGGVGSLAKTLFY